MSMSLFPLLVVGIDLDLVLFPSLLGQLLVSDQQNLLLLHQPKQQPHNLSLHLRLLLHIHQQLLLVRKL